MSQIEWLRDVDRALERAKREGKPVLVDFTAAPA
ncbi:MAG TPA: thioredoxin family protein [Longimicrobiales bacterium]